jgi:hypothetical protein
VLLLLLLLRLSPAMATKHATIMRSQNHFPELNRRRKLGFFFIQF